MPSRQWKPLLGFLHHLAAPRGEAASDRQLLERFCTAGEEAAFALLMQRHGPMVFDVCRRVLDDPHAAEDAFQATFLVLVRRARSVRRPELLANWLYGVAYRTALKARTQTARRRLHERQFVAMPPVEPANEVVWRDLRPVLDEEIDRLPARYRTPFVLCCLEGKTKEETAGQLGLPPGTVSSRLARARDRLRSRLVRRGIALSTGTLATLLAENVATAVPGPLAHSTLKAAMLVAAGNATAGAVSVPVAALTQGVLQAMFLTKMKTAAVTLLALTALGAGLGVGTYHSRADDPSGDDTAAPARPVVRGQAPSPPPARGPLHGVWRVESVEMDGEQLTPKANARWVIAERHINRYEGDKSVGRWAYELVSGEPRGAIELVPPDSTAPLHGIFAVEGDTLRLCYSPRSRPRPTRFATTPGGGQVLFTLQRRQLPRERTGTPPPPAPVNPPEVNDRVAIQGTWVPVYTEQNGQPSQRGAGTSHEKWTIGPEKIEWGKQNRQEMTYTIEQRRRPKWFDLTLGGRTLHGIYALHGDTLAVCLNLTGGPVPANGGGPQYVARPADFTTTGGREILWLLRRDNGAGVNRHLSRDELALERERLSKEMDEETVAIQNLRKTIEELKQRKAEEARRRAAEEEARLREQGELAKMQLQNLRLQEQVRQLRKELQQLRNEQRSLEGRGSPPASAP